VANYIDENAENGDLLLFNAGFCQTVFNYYFKRDDLIEKPFPEETEYVDAENINELEPTVKGYSRVWLILSYSPDDERLIEKKLSEFYHLSYYEKYIDLNDRGPACGWPTEI